MDNIDFAALPDAEAARLMAEKDGLSPRPYTTSIDAAVGWLGRMGLELAMLKQGKEYPWLARCKGQPINHTGPTAARALCNAGWAAVQAREAMSEKSLLYVEIDGIRQPILNPHGELEWRLRYHPAPNDPMIAAGFINSIEYLLNMPHKDAMRRFVAMRRAYKKAKKEASEA